MAAASRMLPRPSRKHSFPLIVSLSSVDGLLPHEYIDSDGSVLCAIDTHCKSDVADYDSFKTWH